MGYGQFDCRRDPALPPPHRRFHFIANPLEEATAHDTVRTYSFQSSFFCLRSHESHPILQAHTTLGWPFHANNTQPALARADNLDSSTTHSPALDSSYFPISSWKSVLPPRRGSQGPSCAGSNQPCQRALPGVIAFDSSSASRCLSSTRPIEISL